MPSGRYIPGSHGCDEFRRWSSVSRRSVLAAGGAASLSGLMPSLPASAQVASTSPGFGKAKRVILLFMWGGPSHLDTFDLKPEAPDEVRGPFKPIATATPGIQLCEHFTKLAGLTDRVAFIRSLNHDDPAHLSSAHTLLTGHLPPVNKSDAEPPSQRDTPHLGALLDKLHPRTQSLGLPGFVTMPWLAYHPSAPGGKAPGQHGGWLGKTFDPLLIEGDPNAPNWQVPALSLLDSSTADRVTRRTNLLDSLDEQRRLIDLAPPGQFLTKQHQAVDLLTSPTVRKAFDLAQEPDEVRNKYGRNIHGQCVLLARRLVEHGVPFVSVNWHNDGTSFWDTHGNNFEKLKNNLIPPADQALSSLLIDLADRGLLDETLVAWVGEFGRQPNINKASAGREHYPYCYSGLMAGAGIA
ncbi:MAG TPA: DUF1501 domain-containing protein, partial [Caulifigura sp.]|nr:DUF1501 domain-containing protein [Caulifigura sp.]